MNTYPKETSELSIAIESNTKLCSGVLNKLRKKQSASDSPKTTKRMCQKSKKGHFLDL